MPWQTRTLRVVVSYLVALTIWGVLALVSSWQTYLVMASGEPGVRFRNVLLLPFTRFFCFALLTPPVFYMARRFPVRSGVVLRRLFALVAGAALFLALFSFLRLMILPPWDIARHRFLPRSLDTYVGLVAGTFVDQLVAYFGIVAVGLALAYYDRARRQEIEKSELQEALAASELQVLKMQLHPHFLFNTLNGISALLEEEPGTAKRMLMHLSQILRSALKHGTSDLVRLQDELEFVSAYLDLQKMRFGPRLSATVEIAPEALELLVPQLILQPLVENAIVHGVTCCRGGGWLKLSAERRGRFLELRVENSTGDAPSTPGSGLGLRNTRARLRSLYRNDGELKFWRAPGVAHAVLRLPALGNVPNGIDELPRHAETAVEGEAKACECSS